MHQARLVQSLLAKCGAVSELKTYKTVGDKRLDEPLASIGAKGLFTQELEADLAAGRVDCCVHSLKDLPTESPAGLEVGALLAREDPRDVLVSEPRRAFDALPENARVGTSSPRRRAQLLAVRPDLEVADARGNVDTRIRRLREGRWDALVLARAGLARLGRLSDACDVFPETTMLPAPGQGALGVFARRDDRGTLELLRPLDDASSRAEVLAERAFLRVLEAGCRAPVAALGRCAAGRVRLTGAVFSTEGDQAFRGEREGAAGDAESVGADLGRTLLERGAAAWLLAERT